MGNRITYKDVCELAESLNSSYGLRLEPSARYGYYALDYGAQGGGVHTITSGLTAREVWECLNALSFVLRMKQREQEEKTGGA